MKQLQSGQGVSLEARFGVDFGRLSLAIQRAFAAGSRHIGADCFEHAGMVARFLRDVGLCARVVVGGVAWRVGAKAHEVVSHTPLVLGAGSGGAVPLHAWVELEDERGRLILDMTTYQLPMKVRLLDEMDGLTSLVTWAPEYFLCEPSSTSTFDEVENGSQPGLVYYEEDKDRGAQIVREIESAGVDAHYYLAVKAVYGNPDVVVLGPGNMP